MQISTLKEALSYIANTIQFYINYNHIELSRAKKGRILKNYIDYFNMASDILCEDIYSDVIQDIKDKVLKITIFMASGNYDYLY